MRSEADKAEVELSVFREFARAANLDVDPQSIVKGNADAGEPDILCRMEGRTVAFELAEACAPEFAAAASRAAQSEGGVAMAWGEDVSHLTLRKKLGKRYSVLCDIHLVIYTDGFTAAHDGYILAGLEPELASGSGPFKAVWLFADDVHRVFPP